MGREEAGEWSGWGWLVALLLEGRLVDGRRGHTYNGGPPLLPHHPPHRRLLRSHHGAGTALSACFLCSVHVRSGVTTAWLTF